MPSIIDRKAHLLNAAEQARANIIQRGEEAYQRVIGQQNGPNEDLIQKQWGPDAPARPVNSLQPGNVRATMPPAGTPVHSGPKPPAPVSLGAMQPAPVAAAPQVDLRTPGDRLIADVNARKAADISALNAGAAQRQQAADAWLKMQPKAGQPHRQGAPINRQAPVDKRQGTIWRDAFGVSTKAELDAIPTAQRQQMFKEYVARGRKPAPTEQPQQAANNGLVPVMDDKGNVIPNTYRDPMRKNAIVKIAPPKPVKGAKPLKVPDMIDGVMTDAIISNMIAAGLSEDEIEAKLQERIAAMEDGDL